MLFLVLIAYFVYYMTMKSESVINSPYNKRLSLASERVTRGSILTSDGEIIAETETDGEGNERRTYPYERMFCHAVGYVDNGMNGLESTYNFDLLESHSMYLKQIINEVRDRKQTGDSLVTTLNYEIQRAAYNALGDRRGAVVALDVKTGKVLAMVSKPDFNPNSISAKWDELVSDDTNSVLLNRATSGLYPPGSTFKILTTLEYIHENSNYKKFTYDCDSSITEGDMTIHCYKNTAHGEEDLKKAFAKSCNTAYSSIGLKLNIAKYNKLAETLFFNQTLPTQLAGTAKSRFKLDQNAGKGTIMATSIGQGQTLASPIHMAMIAAAIDNDGIVMEPYLADRIVNDEDTTIKKFSKKEYGSILSKKDCKIMKEFMRGVVENGTANQMSDDSYTAYGKTGSAEYNESGGSHGWFVGFASKEGKDDIALAVIVEDGGSGSTSAVPVAEEVFDVWEDLGK